MSDDLSARLKSPFMFATEPEVVARIDALQATVAEQKAEIEALRYRMEHVATFAENAHRTGSRDIDDWRDDVYYLGQLARDALAAGGEK